MNLASAGMVCSVGLTAAAACAAMRAGIAMFSELAYRDDQGQPVIGAMTPALDTHLSRGERLVEMLCLALADCLQKQPEWNTQRTPLLVGLAEPDRPGGGAHLADSIVGAVQKQLGKQFHPRYSQGIAKGHIAGFEGLRIAREIMASDRDVEGCIVCGVDSYVNARSLHWLSRTSRLKTDDHTDGVIPGEAAAATLVRRNSVGASGAGTRVLALGFGYEEVHVLAEGTFLATGLAAAARAALAEIGMAMHEIDLRVSDVTGEAYAFGEQSLMLAKLMRNVKPEFPMLQTVDSIGDCGAATGICQLVVLLDLFTKNKTTGTRAICFTSSVSGGRSVAIVEHCGPRPEPTAVTP